MQDVVIVGGGVIGLSTAWELATHGIKNVTVLEQGDFGREASWAGAGMIPPGNPGHSSTHQLAVLSARRWPKFSQRLQELTGIDIGYRTCGGLLLQWDNQIEALLEEFSSAGIAVETLDAAQLRELEPSLSSEVQAGVLLIEQAQVRNPRLLQALTLACERCGVTLKSGHAVTGWETDGERILSAVTPQGKFSASEFILASGAWSEQVAAPLGLHLEVRPIRGQIVLFNSPQRIFRRTLEFGCQYLVPRDDGRVLVGATEEDVGFEKANTESAVNNLINFAHRVVPQLERVSVEKTWAGFRPFAARGFPWIGRPSGWKNLVLSTGHFRAGLSNSPATSQMVRQLLLNQPMEISVEQFQ
ncbi:glycine oxidase ThiO [Planctomicrobium sp. SH527]|uniref:glycine oxidase ThiO n=1 Tax=Planctomicrobium sp. SH527 TaxID=3448123 RepID=UPI003F5B0B4A